MPWSVLLIALGAASRLEAAGPAMPPSVAPGPGSKAAPATSKSVGFPFGLTPDDTQASLEAAGIIKNEQCRGERDFDFHMCWTNDKRFHRKVGVFSNKSMDLLFVPVEGKHKLAEVRLEVDAADAKTEAAVREALIELVEQSYRTEEMKPAIAMESPVVYEVSDRDWTRVESSWVIYSYDVVLSIRHLPTFQRAEPRRRKH